MGYGYSYHQDEIDRFAGLAEDVFNKACELCQEYSGDTFEGGGIIQDSSYSFEDAVNARAKEAIKYGEYNDDETNAFISAAFNELAEQVGSEPLFKTLGMSKITSYVNCSDSHLYVENEKGDEIVEEIALYDEEDFENLFVENYKQAVADLITEYVQSHEEYKNDDKLTSFFKDGGAYESADYLFNEGLTDYVFEIAVALEDKSVMTDKNELTNLKEFLDYDIKNVREELNKEKPAKQHESVQRDE